MHNLCEQTIRSPCFRLGLNDAVEHSSHQSDLAYTIDALYTKSDIDAFFTSVHQVVTDSEAKNCEVFEEQTSLSSQESPVAIDEKQKDCDAIDLQSDVGEWFPAQQILKCGSYQADLRDESPLANLDLLLDRIHLLEAQYEQKVAEIAYLLASWQQAEQRVLQNVIKNQQEIDTQETTISILRREMQLANDREMNLKDELASAKNQIAKGIDEQSELQKINDLNLKKLEYSSHRIDELELEIIGLQKDKCRQGISHVDIVDSGSCYHQQIDQYITLKNSKKSSNFNGLSKTQRLDQEIQTEHLEKPSPIETEIRSDVNQFGSLRFPNLSMDATESGSNEHLHDPFEEMHNNDQCSLTSNNGGNSLSGQVPKQLSESQFLDQTEYIANLEIEKLQLQEFVDNFKRSSNIPIAKARQSSIGCQTLRATHERHTQCDSKWARSVRESQLEAKLQKEIKLKILQQKHQQMLLNTEIRSFTKFLNKDMKSNNNLLPSVCRLLKRRPLSKTDSVLIEISDIKKDTKSCNQRDFFSGPCPSTDHLNHSLEAHRAEKLKLMATSHQDLQDHVSKGQTPVKQFDTSRRINSKTLEITDSDTSSSINTDKRWIENLKKQVITTRNELTSKEQQLLESRIFLPRRSLSMQTTSMDFKDSSALKNATIKNSDLLSSIEEQPSSIKLPRAHSLARLSDLTTIKKEEKLIRASSIKTSYLPSSKEHQRPSSETSEHDDMTLESSKWRTPRPISLSRFQSSNYTDTSLSSSHHSTPQLPCKATWLTKRLETKKYDHHGLSFSAQDSKRQPLPRLSYSSMLPNLKEPYFNSREKSLLIERRRNNESASRLLNERRSSLRHKESESPTNRNVLSRSLSLKKSCGDIERSHSNRSVLRSAMDALEEDPLDDEYFYSSHFPVKKFHFSPLNENPKTVALIKKNLSKQNFKSQNFRDQGLAMSLPSQNCYPFSDDSSDNESHCQTSFDKIMETGKILMSRSKNK